MISAWHLLWIVPVSAAAGAAITLLAIAVTFEFESM